MMLAMIAGSTVGFYILAIVTIFASLRVIMHSNPVHALLSMIVSLLAVAGIFFSLGAPFAGALEIIVYAGAILVLFVFVVMMLNLGTQNEIQEKAWLDAKTWAIPVGLTFIIGLVLISLIAGDAVSMRGSHVAVVNPATWIGVEPVTAKMVGTKLFTEYLLILEVAGFLLLGALVAAYHLAKKSISDENIDHATLLSSGQPPANNLDNKLPNLANEGVMPSSFDNQGEVRQVLHKEGV